MHLANEEQLTEYAARDLLDGKVVGWFQGRFDDIASANGTPVF